MEVTLNIYEKEGDSHNQIVIVRFSCLSYYVLVQPNNIMKLEDFNKNNNLIIVLDFKRTLK